jgi:hypothetical protein
MQSPDPGHGKALLETAVALWHGPVLADVDGSIGELRQHSVNHRLGVEIRRRGWRFRTAGDARGLTDRAEQGKPESLSVLPIALYLDDGEPVRLPRTVSPGTQERRLAAPGWRRVDRDLTRRRAIESGEKVNRSISRGFALSNVTGPPRRLRLTPHLPSTQSLP